MIKKSNRELFISNTIYNVSFKLLNQIIALFILPLFVANLGADLYGIWVISAISVGYLGLLDLGFSQGVMKYISESYAKNNHTRLNSIIVTSSFLFFAIGFIILLIILFFHKNIINIFSIKKENLETAYNLFLVAGFFAPVLWLTKISDTFFQGVLKFKEYSVLSGLKTVGVTLTMLIMVYKGFDIVTIAVAVNVVQILLWLPSILVMYKVFAHLSIDPRLFSFDVIQTIMPFSLGVFYSSVLGALALQADNFIIGIAVSMSGITAYVVASKLFMISYNYMGMLSGVLQPTTFQAFANNDKILIDKLLFKGTKYFTMLYTPIAYLGFIISPLFINTWMGPEYVKYAIWSQAFMAVFIVTSGFGMPINLVFNSGKTRPPNIFKTLSVCVNVFLSILLVHKYGIGGPILGTLIAALLSPLAFPYFCKLIDADWKKLLLLVLKIILINLPSTFFFILLSDFFQPLWTHLFFFSFIVIIIQGYTLYLFFFTTDEKEDMRICLKTMGLSKLYNKVY